MASLDNTKDSEEAVVLIPQKTSSDAGFSPPHSALSHRFRESSPMSPDRKRGSTEDSSIAVMVTGPARPWEYRLLEGEPIVDAVLEELAVTEGAKRYRIEFEDGNKDDVSLQQLVLLRNGENALDQFKSGAPEVMSLTGDSQDDLSDRPAPSRSKRIRTKVLDKHFVNRYSAEKDSDEDVGSEDGSINKKRRLAKGRISLRTNDSTRQGSRANSRARSRDNQDEQTSDSNSEPVKRHGNQRAGASTRSSRRVTRSTNTQPTIKHTYSPKYADNDEDELVGNLPSESDGSEIVFVDKKTKERMIKGRQPRSQSASRSSRGRRDAEKPWEAERLEPSRRSGRDRGAVRSMRERDMDEEIFADDVAKNLTPKVISIREIFQQIPTDSDFVRSHNQDCDVCGGTGKHSNKGTSLLIYCQGCSTSIHKICLGYRSNRESMVTKIGPENFVMQCRRCIGIARKKDSSAPRLDACQVCKKVGASCAPFSPRRTAKQEEKLRDDNEGEDPATEVAKDLVNNAENVLFRCDKCHRAAHFEHLPALSNHSRTPENTRELRQERYDEYTSNWQCKDCCDQEAKVQTIVAWRPADSKSYNSGDGADDFGEDEKEYLIKWEDLSYFQCSWMPGSWVWGVTAAIMRKSFFRRDQGVNMAPKWTNEEAIPEEYLRMEIVFDVEYQKGFRPKSKESDAGRIDMVDRIYVKFQGLTYDDAVWEEPPQPEEDRWKDFKAAYDEYIAGKYFKQPSASIMRERAEDFRKLNFTKRVELKKQPSALTGGEIMPYQMEGLNWLLYKFHQQKNVILADEMGLGKTIQIISLIATLVKDNPKCWPFLVVTPNSTCPNWRREIKKWAPSLRVVAYYGAKKSRDMAMKYELFPDGCSDMRAHIVVTSYEAPVDDYSRSFFRRVKWAGMIVDEGQRLKNDENLLYGALKALKIPFQVLLTGTPLQNNKRELFNLLQFLDPSEINAEVLDEEYAELTKENLPKLHELIRPYFLRRTKLQVLKFLPPMAQVILPVTMSLVQKKLYKSILAKNPELIKSIFGQTKTVLRPTERGNLNNILMQLRKCLCHPFLYSSAIEERSTNEIAMHRNLVEASSKFQLLEIMLPKLRERGHRVLLFSQFLAQLDLIEDFLHGLSLPFQRLDGSITALEKQKRIDTFNAPDSSLFAFLLSTRAGGVGINLATADTVIIMDPDFNPHQDIQALSRAHRIGQKKKVLVFQLMTKDTAEEKIVQIGRKKMALDQALIESMGAEDDAGVDLESILKHGAEALFNDDDENDIHYDSASVDKLLDRTKVENTNTDEDKSAESAFSFARVWANDKGALTEDLGDPDLEPAAPNPSVWDKILKQREADAAAEAARNLQTFGRGKRARQNIDYKRSQVDLDDAQDSSRKKLKNHRLDESASDLDFASNGESEPEEDSDGGGQVYPQELETQKDRPISGGIMNGTADPGKELYDLPPSFASQFQVPRDRMHQFHAPFQNSSQPPPPRQYYTLPPGNGIVPIQAPEFPPILPPNSRYHNFLAADPVERSSYPTPYTRALPQAAPHPTTFYNTNTIPRPSFKVNGAGDPLQRQDVSRPFSKTPQVRLPRRQGPAEMAYCGDCKSVHPIGNCNLHRRQKTTAAVCQSCKIDHFGLTRKCPQTATDPEIRVMLDNLLWIQFPQDKTVRLHKYLHRILSKRAKQKREDVQQMQQQHSIQNVSQ